MKSSSKPIFGFHVSFRGCRYLSELHSLVSTPKSTVGKAPASVNGMDGSEVLEVERILKVRLVRDSVVCLVVT